MQKNTKTEAIVNYVRANKRVSFTQIQRFICQMNHIDISKSSRGYYSTSIQRIAIAYLHRDSDKLYSVASDVNIAARYAARKAYLSAHRIADNAYYEYAACRDAAVAAEAANRTYEARALARVLCEARAGQVRASRSARATYAAYKAVLASDDCTLNTHVDLFC